MSSNNVGGKFDKFLSVFLIILFIAIIATAGYLLYKGWEKNKLNNDADNFLDDQFENYVEDISSEDDTEEEEDDSTQVGERGFDANGLTYKGYSVAGKIELPTVGLRYPVLGEYINGTWQITDANAIEVAVAIQYGVGLNNVGNTVIIGHNYRSGLFFGSNKKLQIGDSIYITDTATGTRKQYTIYNKYTADESDTSFYNRDTAGKREVTLVTCQTDNHYRLIIFARESN